MHYYDNVLGLIGRTPLVKLNRMNRGLKATVLAKMENLNPGFSVKDRIGVAMIEAAEREGKLKPGGTIVEATSGNTGIGLVLAAAVKGYKCIFVMTDKASVEKSRYLKALGADVVITPVSAKPGTPDHYVSTAQRIAKETPNSFYPDQYSHPANPEAHYRTTGPEIWEQTEGKITHFVAGIGTGGTISGTGRFLKEQNPKIRVVGADPYGSIFKTYKETGKLVETTPYLVEGIGQEVVPPNVHIKYVDEVINVTDGESFEMSRQLGRTEGIFCGGSSGTNLAAALRVAKDLDENAVIVFIVCDTGEHYLTKHHSDEWLKEKRLLEPQKMTAGLISDTKGDKAPESLAKFLPRVMAAIAQHYGWQGYPPYTPPPPIEDKEPEVTAQVRKIVEQAQLGKFERGLFTEKMAEVFDAYLHNAEELHRIQAYGTVRSIALVGKRVNGAKRGYRYHVLFENESTIVVCSFNEEGRIGELRLQLE